MPKLSNSKGLAVTLCDVTFIPDVTWLRVEVDPYKSPEGVPVGRQYVHVCDRAIAKIIARTPGDVDASAGMCVPSAPAVGQLNHFGRRRLNTLTVLEYLQEVNRVWQEAKKSDYVYSTFTVDPAGSAMEKNTKSASSNFSMYAYNRVIFSNLVLDEAVRVYYNTSAEVGFEKKERNECVTRLLGKASCADVAVGECLLQRFSLKHDVPLGLTKELLKSYFGTDAPGTALSGRRVRTQAAVKANKRRKQVKKELEKKGVAPQKGEVRMVRIAADGLNPFSEVIVSEKDLDDQLKVLLGFDGELAENLVKKVPGQKEVVVITVASGSIAEMTHHRTFSGDAYCFNETAGRMFPAIDISLLEGPVVVAMRKGEGYVHFGLDDFRKFCLGK